jgi:hypothetical protein
MNQTYKMVRAIHNHKYFLIFVILTRLIYSQVLPYGEPKYFSLNPVTTSKQVFFTDGKFNISNLKWKDGTKIINDNSVLYFLHYSLEKESSFYALLDNNNFPEKSELYLINPTEKSWVGPYRKEYLSRESISLTGRIKSSEFILELSVPKNTQPPEISFQKFSYQQPKIKISDKLHVYPINTSRENPVILLTGYWPPTNEAVRPFSQNALLNPDGWIGENWEELGYDIISFFPSFNPPDCNDCGQGYGDLEVDYQDTSEDWWNIVETHDPVAIITFSRGYINNSWEMEWKYYNRLGWIDDFTLPYQPTPAPPDQDSPINHMRFSSLPMTEIVEAINSSDLDLYSYIDYAEGAGGYLSEYKGFHGVWYKGLMENEDETPCYLAGHVHVGGLVDWGTAHEAVLITVRETIDYIYQHILTPGDVNRDGTINSLDIIMVLSYLNGIIELTDEQFFFADMNEDAEITTHDVVLLVNELLFDDQ